MTSFSRTILISYLSLIFIQGPLFAENRTLYARLLEANRNWAGVSDSRKQQLSYPIEISESELLKKHLSLVEESLRGVDVSRLTPNQREARSKHLDSLHDYWTSQASPQNQMLPYRNPVFIDEHNRICAVGYLMARDGYQKLASRLANTNDTVFIRDIQDTDFLNWVKSSGLSIDELAWIQPMYGPENEQAWSPLGRGIQGEIHAIAIDQKNRVYAAGRFDRANNGSLIKNIASFNGSHWQSLGTGTNGPVRSIAIDGTNIFAGGDFGVAGSVMANNVAVFDTRLNRWKKLGDGLPGSVHGLILYKGSLYASGIFPSNRGDVRPDYLRRWNAKEKQWDNLAAFNGEIKAMTVFQDRLVLGGDFTKLDEDSFSHIVSFDGDKWQQMGTGVENTFSAMTVFKDQLVVGSLTRTVEKGDPGKVCNSNIQVWDGSAWKSHVLQAEYVADTETCPMDGRVRAIAGIGNALAVSMMYDSPQRPPKDGNPITFHSWIKQENGRSEFIETGYMLTGLSQINSLAAHKKQILMGGSFETDPDLYLASAERRAALGRNVLPYYRLESGLNQIRFGNLKGETMFIPANLFAQN